MFALMLILFILECGSFCYLFFNMLEVKKDIDTLYENYSNELERITKTNISKRGTVLK